MRFIRKKADKKSLCKRGLILGVGVNDADYVTQYKIDGKYVQCPIYTKWVNMLARCYNKNFLKNRPSYIGCTVSKPWLKFSVFSEWYEENSVDGWHLDKDLIMKGNKVYSPEMCLFVPVSINSLLLNSASSRGEFPVGVYFNKSMNKFKSQITIDNKVTHLGYHETVEEAYSLYVKSKNNEINRKCEQYPQFAKYLKNHLIEL